MCQQFDFLLARTLNAYRDFVDDIGRKKPSDRKPFINCTQQILCSIPEFEHGFSHMNIIISDTHNKSRIPSVSLLMFIKLHSPPVVVRKLNFYVKTWLRKHRFISHTRTHFATLNSKLDSCLKPLWKYM